MPRFENTAEVSFLGDITLQDLKEKAVNEYMAAFSEISGESAVVDDEIRAVLYAAAQIIYQNAYVQNGKAKQNLLKYSSGSYLDNLGLTRGLNRKSSERAVVTIRFTLSAPREGAVAIPAGTRVTSSAAKIYFEVDEYTEISPGNTYADINCTAIEGGSNTNNFAIGELNVLADPIAYVGTVSNIDNPTGGADAETDDDYAQRIFDSRYLYTTAGAEGAYIYYTKEYSTLIDGVVVENPRDAEIEIYITLKDGSTPTEGFLSAVTAYVADKKIRPLTDKVTVKAATEVDYTIDAEYSVYSSRASELTTIEDAVAAAVEKYKKWQSETVGRDINTQKLLSLMIEAGAATVNIKSPQNTKVERAQVAKCTETNIHYTGIIED